MGAESTGAGPTGFQNEAGKKAVYVDRDGRPVRVLIDTEEYERLMARYKPQVLHPSELDDAMKAEIEKDFQGRATPELDHLME